MDRDRDVRGGMERERSVMDRLGPQPMPTANFGNTYGLSAPFLESLGIDGPLHTRVFVANVSTFSHEKIPGANMILKNIFSPKNGNFCSKC
jgi:hypothetical protein